MTTRATGTIVIMFGAAALLGAACRGGSGGDSELPSAVHPARERLICEQPLSNTSATTPLLCLLPKQHPKVLTFSFARSWSITTFLGTHSVSNSVLADAIAMDRNMMSLWSTS